MLFPNIEAERARDGLTQKALSEFLGVSRKTLTNWMTGKTEIPSAALIKMSNKWGCSTDYLLGLTGKAS